MSSSQLRYYNRNKEKYSKYRKQYYILNKEKLSAYGKQYNASNRGKNAAAKKYKYQNDVQFRLAEILRGRIRGAVKEGWKLGSAVKDLGCTVEELKFYLEGQFQDGMTWDNWSKTGWHIDHKIPLTFFNLTDRGQFLQAVHYTNLQPMWASENLRKGGINRQKRPMALKYSS